jgi:hypothetical protein
MEETRTSTQFCTTLSKQLSPLKPNAVNNKRGAAKAGTPFTRWLQLTLILGRLRRAGGIVVNGLEVRSL